jgi:tripartite-type tricarboxylate transporter receptor subunit TctC
MIVQSMPGAGGVRMLNEAAVRMSADGTSIFLPPDTTVVTQVLEPNAVTYDARRFHYIGTADQQNMVWVVRKDKARNAADMLQREVFMGSSGKGSTGYIIPNIAMALMGLKVKPVGGYQGSRDTILAMERREIDGSVQGWQVWIQARPDWFSGPDAFAVAIMQVGAAPDVEIPQVPLLRDLVKPEDRGVVSLLDTIGMIGRSLAAPPGVPAAYVEALRGAFDKMVADTEFRSEAQKMQLRVTPRTGAELQKDIASSMSSLDAAAVQRARALVN